METVYRQSIMYLVPKLAIDGIFCFMFIGVPFLIKHLLEFMNTQIELTKMGIVLKKGTIGSTVTEIPYSKVNSISVRKGLLGSMFGYGDIVISTGNDIVGIRFPGIANPDEIKRAINSKQ